MNEIIAQFLTDDTGQDLIEYSLLIAFVVLGSAVLFKGAGTSVSGIWTATNTRLANANAVASS